MLSEERLAEGGWKRANAKDRVKTEAVARALLCAPS